MNENLIHFIQSEYCAPLKNKYGAIIAEPDKYSETAIQLCALENNEIYAAVRIILGSQNQITNRLAIPMEQGCAELSRLVVHRQCRRSAAVLFALLHEAHKVAQENDITHFIAAATRQSEKIFRVFGFPYVLVKQDVEYFGQPCNVVKWEISAAESKLTRRKFFNPDSHQTSLEVIRYN